MEQAEPGGVSCNESQGLADLVVVVGVEADLVHVERLGAVDIGNRDGDELDLPVHAGNLHAGSSEMAGEAGAAHRTAWSSPDAAVTQSVHEEGEQAVGLS